MTKAAELAKMGEVLTNSQIGGRRNIVINGAMQVAQRATSATGLGASAGYFTLDRYNSVSNTSGRFTMSQSTVTDLPGFANALKIDCTTADTSIAADEYFLLQYKLEGQNLQQFKKGTSSAEKMTVSFYVKGNANATYVCELYDQDNAREIAQTFSVTSSWNRVVLTYDGDTTGAFDDDNVLSMYISFWLHAGSNHNSGTLSTTWTSITNANRAVGISSFFDSTDRTLEITGLQLEVGDFPSGTPFEHLSYGETLALCQRYFEYRTGGISSGIVNSSSTVQSTLSFHVTKRAAPTTALVGTPIGNDGTQEQNVTGINNNFNIGVQGTLIDLACSLSNTTSPKSPALIYSNPATPSAITLDAEL